MSGYTKGPLAARDLGNAEWEIVKEDASAIDGVWFVALCYNAADGASAEANAKLFAAAPDLVEALRIIERNETQVFDDDLECLVTVSMDAEEMAEVARTALRKALGEGEAE